MAGIELGILAGYDGSPGSQEALAWAAAETRSRGSPLTVCSAWAPGYLALPDEVAFDLARRSGERMLAQGVQFVHYLMVPAENSLSAPWGRGGVEGMMLGSVSTALLQHGPCPVGIVHSG